MLVVVDTNVMLSAFARHSPIARLFRALANGEVRMAVTSAIILEYEEIAGERGGLAFAAKVMHWLSLLSAAWDSVDVVQPSFQFGVVSSDPDDNKFVDCAIVANADFVITNDAHYAALAHAGYKPQPIKPEDFIARYLSP
ncbi:MAG: putative toxin-antitoxin system toxin component, PIN family [Chthoniobacteraceae bacterium]